MQAVRLQILDAFKDDKLCMHQLAELASEDDCLSNCVLSLVDLQLFHLLRAQAIIKYVHTNVGQPQQSLHLSVSTTHSRTSGSLESVNDL